MARPRTFDEPQVLRRARETFHDYGYTATSIDQLSEATGLNRSSIYGAFGDKHGLFMQSFAQYCDEDIQLIEQELAGDQAGALRRLRRHFRLKTSDPVSSRRGCLLAKTAAELASQDADIARMASAFYARYQASLTDCVEKAQAVGDLRTDIPANETAAMLLAVLRGIEALGRAGQNKHLLQQITNTAVTSLAPART